MNIAKSHISKRFTKKYCSKPELKLEPPHILSKVGEAYGVVFVLSILGGGIYGSYKGFKKNDEINEDVFTTCMVGIVGGAFVGAFSPFIIPGYLIKKISDKIE